MKKFIIKNFHNIYWLMYSILILKYVHFVCSDRQFNLSDLGFIMIISLCYTFQYCLQIIEYKIELDKNLLDEDF